jgi:hypothetical protein
MMIIGGVLLALIAVQISAAQTIVDARKREQATAIANQAMEQMRAIPWTYLSIGLHTTFKTAAGGDPYVSGGTVTLPGESTFRTLKLGTQDLTKPRPPLFSSTGSNKSVVTDAAVTNTSFTVRSYVLQPVVGGVNTLGLAVIVSWIDKDGNLAETVLESTAYRGTGCGNPNEAPYLATCQATFEGVATSGTLSTSVFATTTPDGVSVPTPVNLLSPTSDPFMELAMRSASVGVSAQGQQVTSLLAAAQFGGSQKDDADPATEPLEEGWIRGYATAEVRATDDVTQTGTPTHVASTSLQQSATAESEWTLSDSGTSIDFRSRSDFRRPVTATASSTTSCKTGIPAGSPCAAVEMTNNTSLDQGSGYILMNVGSQIFRLSRRVVESAPPGNNDHAWIARYTTTPSTADAVGCRPAVSGAGCMATGASRALAKLTIGTVVGGNWTGQAVDGIVIVEGAAACTGGANAGFNETVMVQRGSSQRSTAAVTTRCGQIRYWNGSSYTTQAIGNNPLGTLTSAPVTWTGGGYTVTATATISATGVSSVPVGPDANCATKPCEIRAQTGAVEVAVVYVISGPGTNYAVTSLTTIEGPSAAVTYQEAPIAAP